MYYQEKYDSANQSEYQKIDAPYYNAINPTEIAFTQERTTATINSLGHIEFFDAQGASLGFVDLPVSKDPSEKGHTAQYGDAYYKAAEGKVFFCLPVYDWRDYYPHCDGESDRWDRFVVRWFEVVFDCTTHQINVEA